MLMIAPSRQLSPQEALRDNFGTFEARKPVTHEYGTVSFDSSKLTALSGRRIYAPSLNSQSNVVKIKSNRDR